MSSPGLPGPLLPLADLGWRSRRLPGLTPAGAPRGLAALAASGGTVQERRAVRVRRLPTRSLLNRCTSDRMPFDDTINPYRGCEFGCVYCYARYTHDWLGHDDPDVTPSDKCRYDACLTVDEAFRPVGEVGIQTIAGGDYVRTTHEGPYDGLGAHYRRLFREWFPVSGREPASAPCFEVYLNSPESTAPEDLLTDVYFPLASEEP